MIEADISLNLAVQQASKNPLPPTIAAATTVIPTTFITFISGTTNIATITPPSTGAHMLCFIYTNGSPGQLVTTGNVAVALTTIAQKVPVLLFYDPSTAKYYAK